MTRRAATPAAPPRTGDAPGARAGADPHDPDAAWLDALAARVVARGFAAPALLALESVGPLTGLAAHALAFLRPFAVAVTGGSGVARLERLLARRDNVERLATRIETLTVRR